MPIVRYIHPVSYLIGTDCEIFVTHHICPTSQGIVMEQAAMYIRFSLYLGVEPGNPCTRIKDFNHCATLALFCSFLIPNLLHANILSPWLLKCLEKIFALTYAYHQEEEEEGKKNLPNHSTQVCITFRNGYYNTRNDLH